VAEIYSVGLELKVNNRPLDQAIDKIQRFERRVDQLQGRDPFQGASRSARAASSALDGMNGRLRDASGRFIAAGSAAGSAGNRFAAAGRDARVAAGGIGKLSGAIGGLVSAYALLQAGKFIFGKTAELETQTRSIQVLTGSLEKAKDIVGELQQYANVTPFTSTEIIDSAKRLTAFGVSAEKVVETTKRLGDVAGATGANLGQLSLVYGQVMAKGRLQGEELLQFQERGVGLQDELRKMYGLTGQEFSKALEKGQISAAAVELALKRLTSTGGKYADGAISQSDTLAGKFSTLQDGIENVARSIGTALEPAIKSILGIAIDAVNEINGLMETGKLMTGFGSALSDKKRAELFNSVDADAKKLAQLRYDGGRSGKFDSGVFASVKEDLFRDRLRQYGYDSGLLTPPKAKPPAATSAAIPPLLGGNTTGSGSSSTKGVEEAVRRGVIGGLTGGGQSGASRGRSTGPHLHAQLVKGSNLEKMVDAALDFGGGKTASSFGLGRGAGARGPNGHGYPARDYYTPQGTPFTLKPGWSASDMGIQGALGRGMRISGPGGVFELGHLAGVKTGDLNGKGAASDLANAQQDALDAQLKSLQTGRELTTEYSRQIELQGASTEQARQRLEIQYQHQDRQQKINELMDAGQRKELTGLNDRIKTSEVQKLEIELLVDKARLLEGALRPIADENELLEARLKGTEKELIARREIAALTNAGMAPDAAKALVAKNQQLKAADSDPVTQLVRQWNEELGNTKGMISSLAQTVQGELSTAMSSAITGVIQGTTTVQQAFSQMFANIGAAFIDMATQMIAKALIMKVLGILGGGLGGGFGGLGSVSSKLSFDPSGMAGFNQPWSFSGGGYTGDGPRSGGLDGEGGYLAMVHPQETVIDHTDARSAMQRYRPGNGPGSAAAGVGGATADSEAGGGGGTFTLQTVVINNVEYATVDQVRAMGAAAAQQGAAAGHTRVMGDFRNKRSVRARMGL
jgi:tape measure domain-containing protein